MAISAKVVADMLTVVEVSRVYLTVGLPRIQIELFDIPVNWRIYPGSPVLVDQAIETARRT